MQANIITEITHTDDKRFYTFSMIGNDYRPCEFTIDAVSVDAECSKFIMAIIRTAIENHEVVKFTLIRELSLVYLSTKAYPFQIPVDVTNIKTGYSGVSIAKLNDDEVMKIMDIIKYIKYIYHSIDIQQ